MTRRIITLLSVSAFVVCMGCHQTDQPIDRYDLVTRHNVVIDQIDPLAPVQVGNGDFAFTADVTGAQSLGAYYQRHGIPLETRATWAWHTFPDSGHLTLQGAMKGYDFHGREVEYASLQHTPAGDYFRKNPQPTPLGQISLVKSQGQALDTADITKIHQTLELWKGLLISEYALDGTPVKVNTIADPSLSLVAFSVHSPLLKSGALKIAFHFPYAYDLSYKNKPPFLWGYPGKNKTTILEQNAHQIVLKRMTDTSVYYVEIHWENQARWIHTGDNEYLLDATGSDSLKFSCAFSTTPPVHSSLSFEKILAASETSWKAYWMKGGAIDLSGSTDPRAGELERRIILSEYLMKVNYAGSFPPQESGLVYLSWYGKHNSEMYWWHAAQFYQWHRTSLLEKGLHWYQSILPSAEAEAKKKGFQGAKWPKMSGPQGRPSPGTINPFIIWNEPNLIYLCELVYRARPNDSTLRRYKDLVLETARFMASFAFYDSSTDRYILGPPIKGVSESNVENDTKNPGFELAYWYYGLTVAQQWRERLGLAKDPHWEDIIEKISPMPVDDGKYVELETSPDMYQHKGHFSSAMIMALGYLPQTPMVNTEIMKKTFDAIVARNGLQSFVSWSMGKGAMTAARLGEQQTAVDIVCNNSPQSRFSKSGYVQRPKELKSGTNPAYLPVNSSFLSAVALMAAGWDGAPDIRAPGFPQNGTWHVRVENLNKLP